MFFETHWKAPPPPRKPTSNIAPVKSVPWLPQACFQQLWLHANELKSPVETTNSCPLLSPQALVTSVRPCFSLQGVDDPSLDGRLSSDDTRGRSWEGKKVYNRDNAFHNNHLPGSPPAVHYTGSLPLKPCSTFLEVSQRTHLNRDAFIWLPLSYGLSDWGAAGRHWFLLLPKIADSGESWASYCLLSQGLFTLGVYILFGNLKQ